MDIISVFLQCIDELNFN